MWIWREHGQKVGNQMGKTAIRNVVDTALHHLADHRPTCVVDLVRAHARSLPLDRGSCLALHHDQDPRAKRGTREGDTSRAVLVYRPTGLWPLKTTASWMAMSNCKIVNGHESIIKISIKQCT